MNAAKKGLFNVFYGLLSQIITICLGLVIPRLVLLSFGSETNGLLNSIAQIFLYFGIFESGVGAVALHALYVPVEKKDRGSISGIISAVHEFYSKIGIIYIFIVIALAFGYPFFVKTEIPYWTIVIVILLGGMGNCLNFLYQAKYKILMQAEGYSYVSTNITTIINILTNVVKAGLLLAGYDVIAVQLSFFIISIIQMCIYHVYVRKHYSWLNLRVLPNRKAIEQKNATLIHEVSGMVFYNTDSLLLMMITHNLKIVSIYSMYNSVVAMVVVMINQLGIGFNFRLGQIYNTNKEQYMVLHHIFEIVYLILVFTTMSIVYVCLLPFMRLYTAGINDINYINEIYPLLFVMIPLLTYGRTACANVIGFAGHFKKTQWRAALEAVINVSVSIWGIYNFGIFGALMGTMAASLYRTNDIILYTYRHLLKDNPLKTYKRWLASFAVFAIIVAFVKQDNIVLDSYINIILYGCISGVIFAIVFIVVQCVINPKEVKDIINIAKSYYKSWKNKKRTA